MNNPHQSSLFFPPPGPSGLVQNSRSTSVSVPQYPQVASDSDSEEDECFVSKLVPPSRLQPPSVTKGTCTAQRKPEVGQRHLFADKRDDLSTGKGKTPVRRSNNPPAAPPASADQNVAIAASERSCEKSCQVTSEQIKADMKAAAEKKRCCSKEPTSRAGAGTGKSAAGPEVNVHADAARAASTPPTSSVEGVEHLCAGASRQPPSSRRQSTGTNFSHMEDSCKARTRGTRDSQRTTAADMDGQDCGRAAQLGANEKASCDPHSHQRANHFVPRRPLTRSCTRLSAVSLLPETGETEICKINTEHIL